MQGHYGSRFLNMWKTGHQLPDGSDAGLLNAMNHWSEKLGGFADHPECIKHALEALPETPPTLPQFVAMCRHAPRKDAPALEHKLTPEEIERNKQKIRSIMEDMKDPQKMQKMMQDGAKAVEAQMKRDKERVGRDTKD